MYKWEIIILCALFSAELSLCEPIDCLYGLQDYEKIGWEFDSLLALTASTSESLPAPFRSKPGLKSGNGIICFDGNVIEMIPEAIPSLYKLPYTFDLEMENYIYIKYYTHLENRAGQRAYILPIVNQDSNNLQELQITSNFSWIEAYYKINIQDIIDENVYALDIGAENFKPGDYFFVDTVNVVQGHKITDISQFTTLCPGNIEDPEEITTTTTTEIPQLPQPAILECIDDSIHFDYYKWDSFPHYNYALTSIDLPDIFQGKLVGRGIFFFDGSENAPNQQIFKPASLLNDTSPTFLYIKYYGHSNGSGSGSGADSCKQAQAYVTPVVNSDGDQFKILETSSDFMWREELVEVDTEIALRIGVQLQFTGSSKGDFLIVDEIIFTQGAVIQNLQEIKSLCLPALNAD